MLTLKRKRLADLTELELWLARAACEETQEAYNNSILNKYYSYIQANIDIITNNNREIFIMYSSYLPIGALGISINYHPYLTTRFFNEDFLYISPEYRSLKTLMFLIKTTLAELSAGLTEPTPMIAGNLLGTHRVESAYLRAGFSKFGSTLVIELGEHHE